MLAQNFMTAADLGLADEEQAALVALLGMLERGELHHVPLSDVSTLGDIPENFTGGFNMEYWAVDTPNCGSVCCIGGSAEMIGGLRHDQLFNKMDALPALDDLFMPDADMDAITPAQAAMALRNYLTTGQARWSEVL
jgi:hypothetical protein